MTDAPHLPPETCSIFWHKTKLGLPWFIVFVVVAFLAGVAASLSTIVWIAPNVVYDTSTYVFPKSTKDVAEDVGVDPSFVHDIEQQFVRVYDRNLLPQPQVYIDSALVGNAAVLSSDGWVVLYNPTYVRGEESRFQIVGFQGVSYDISQTIFDSNSGFVYMKLLGNDFRVTSFISLDDTAPRSSVWVVSSAQWSRDQVHFDDALFSEEQIFASTLFDIYALSQSHEPGSAVVTDAGTLVGFVSATGDTVRPVQFVAHALPFILRGETISYPSLSLSGRFVDGYTSGNRVIADPGFLVSRALGIAQLRSGDVIVKINDTAIVPQLFAWEYLLDDQDKTFSRIRADVVERGILSASNISL